MRAHRVRKAQWTVTIWLAALLLLAGFGLPRAAYGACFSCASAVSKFTSSALPGLNVRVFVRVTSLPFSIHFASTS